MSHSERRDAYNLNCLTTCLYIGLNKSLTVSLLVSRKIYVRGSVEDKRILIDIRESPEGVRCCGRGMAHFKSLGHYLKSVITFLVLHYVLNVLTRSAKELKASINLKFVGICDKIHRIRAL